MERDHVDGLVAQWQAERPELNFGPMAIVGRLSRLASDVQVEVEKNLARFGLQGGRFDVLAALRRQGPPFVLKPTDLGDQMLLTSGAVTHRLDVLEEAGWIRRSPDPEDRRGTLVALTERGQKLVDEALVSHLETEARWLGALEDDDRRALADALRRASLAQGL